MSKQFTPCPACGAVGEVGSTCQFCGTTITLKEGATSSDTRIIAQRTITPQQYAERISIYHNIEGLCDGVSKVSIGEQEGIINLNGDLIYPLGNEHITKCFQDSIVGIGEKFLNLESFEYVEDPYSNKAILEKITKMSNAIINDPSTDARIVVGCNNAYIGFSIHNAYNLSEEFRFTPGLVLVIDFDEAREWTDETEIIKIYKRFASCDEFKLFESANEVDSYGEPTFDYEKQYYIAFGDDAKKCCRTMLRVLYHIYGEKPDDIDDYVICTGDIFDDNQNTQTSNSSNSGCAGMLALMLGIGGASVYGIVELISRLIA